MDKIIIGVIAIIISGVLTNYYRKKAGAPRELTDHLPGTGIIPSWVSFINLGGWALIVWGLLILFI